MSQTDTHRSGNLKAMKLVLDAITDLSTANVNLLMRKMQITTPNAVGKTGYRRETPSECSYLKFTVGKTMVGEGLL